MIFTEDASFTLYFSRDRTKFLIFQNEVQTREILLSAVTVFIEDASTTLHCKIHVAPFSRFSCSFVTACTRVYVKVSSHCRFVQENWSVARVGIRHAASSSRTLTRSSPLMHDNRRLK